MYCYLLLLLTTFDQFISKDEKEREKFSLNHAVPLNTLRLLPTRHQTKNAVLSILESGEVALEFLKKKGPAKEERVIDVCRISNDGLRVSNTFSS